MNVHWRDDNPRLAEIIDAREFDRQLAEAKLHRLDAYSAAVARHDDRVRAGICAGRLPATPDEVPHARYCPHGFDPEPHPAEQDGRHAFTTLWYSPPGAVCRLCGGSFDQHAAPAPRDE